MKVMITLLPDTYGFLPFTDDTNGLCQWEGFFKDSVLRNNAE